jgi:CRISPR-associated protein Csh1
VKINGKVYGFPNFNMGLNSKKPYLENKTRKSKLPMLVDSDKISMEKKLFDYLMNYASEGKNYIYAKQDDIEGVKVKENKESNFQGYFFRVNKGKEVEIVDYDSVTDYKYKLKKIIRIIPILKHDLGKDFKSIKGNLSNISELKNIINEAFFNKYLVNNFFTEPKDIKLNDSKVKEILLKYRYGFYTWFYKGEDILVRNYWNKMTLDLLCNSISQGNLNKSINQFNLRHAVLDYFGEENGGESMSNTIRDIRKSVDEKINIKKDKDYKVEIDDVREYYFCIGQLLKYFYSLNKSSSKNFSFINPILNASDDKVVKEKLRRLFIKYSYAIKSSFRFSNMYYMVSAYNSEKGIDKDLIIAGFLCPSLIYKKSEENSEDENNNIKKHEEEN